LVKQTNPIVLDLNTFLYPVEYTIWNTLIRRSARPANLISVISTDHCQECFYNLFDDDLLKLVDFANGRIAGSMRYNLKQYKGCVADKYLQIMQIYQSEMGILKGKGST
jgi:hypothetical protein